MLKIGEKVALGSDTLGKYFVELTATGGENSSDGRVRIIAERSGGKADAVEVPVAIIEPLFAKLQQKELRRSQEEE
jgi:hypothetical protein